MTQSIQTPEQHYYLAKLLGYDYTIKYKSGQSNIAVDALSRRNEQVAKVSWILSVPHFQFLDDLKSELMVTPEYVTLFKAVRDYPLDHPGFTINDELLLHKGRIWLNKGNSFIPLLLEEFHKSLLGGHTGFVKTLSRLQQSFTWPDMRKDVQLFVKSCTDCQYTKYMPQKPQGLLQPIPPPTCPWEDMALDFITSLPLYQGATVILKVVDRFSKSAHFGILPTHFIAHRAAQLFIDMVCKLHGFPKSLISDRDPVFMSRFWQELFKINGTKLRMSTMYHPQSDG